MVKQFTAAVPALLALTMPGAALACTCAPWQSARAHIDAVDVIFEGVAVSTSKAGSGDSHEVETRFRVTRSWKGRSSGTVGIRHNVASPACGVAFEPGKPYRVFARQERDGAPLTNLCLMLMSDPGGDNWNAYTDILEGRSGG